MNDRIVNDLIRYAELVEDGALVSPEEMNCASLMRIAAEALMSLCDGAQPAVTESHKQEPVAIMREMLEVQGQHGNWNYDSYMHGLYNGMEYMVALAEKRGPQFRDAPETWLAKYEVKRNNFNSTEPLTEATPPQRTAAEGEDTRRAWVGLTEEEIEACFHYVDEAGIGLFDFAEAVEAKLKEKNT